MTANPLLRLAAHAAMWRDRALPPALERHARRALVDWFAAMLPGSRPPPVALLAPALAPGRGQGAAICYADGAAGAVRHAALLNGIASHTVEFDDIHRHFGYHPGSPTIAAALAMTQDRKANMASLLRAIAAGHEVSCRIGLAVQPSHYRMWHTTGTVGTFGAATAVAVLAGCGPDRIGHAIAGATTMAGGLQQAFRGDGMSKPMHAGHAADAGTLAALAAAAGVTGALDVLHGPAGFAAATSDSTGQWDRALDGLDGWFAIEFITIKNHDQDLSGIRVGLHDEIFHGATPVLAVVDAASTYCYLLAAEERRDADTWGVHLLDAAEQGLDPDYTIADAGQGLRAGQRAAWGDTPCHGDVFHIQRQCEGLATTLQHLAKDATSRRKTLQAKTGRAGQRVADDELAIQLAFARQTETKAHELARDIRTLTQWLSHDVLALAGPALATRQALFKFIVEELAPRA